MENIACRIERWEDRQTNKAHMKQIIEKRHNNMNNLDNTKKVRRRKFPIEEEFESQDGGDSWDSFYEEQKMDTLLPTLGNMLQSMDESCWRQKQRRRHLVGNLKIGGISHRLAVAPEAPIKHKSQRKPQLARAAWFITIQGKGDKYGMELYDPGWRMGDWKLK